MKKKKVLIIDDEVNFAHMIKLVLEQTGRYEVVTENKSPRALSVVREAEPDIILLDVLMPEMNGFQVLEALKKEYPALSIPVILLTAITTEEAKMKAAGGYSEDYVEKPVTGEALMRKIDEVLKRFGTAAE